jgi:acyl transferase domain-containing protein
MGEELYRTEAVFRSEVDTCAEYLRPLLGLDLRQVLYPAAAEEAAARERIHETRVAQPAIFTIELALARLWMSWGIQPAALAGHSIGEYVAAVIAGVFSLDEALGLLAARARMMQGLPPGGMLAVKLGAAELEPLLAGQPLAIAASNSPTLTVVSGPSPELEALRTRLAARRVVTKPLGTSHAFHSAMVDPVLPGFTELVSRTRRQPPRIPMMSTLNASWFTGQEAADPGYWARQMRHSVRFVEAMHQLLQTPARVYLEVGPGQTLTPFVRQHPSHDPLSAAMASLPPTQDPGHDLEFMLGSLGRLWTLGVTVDWAGFRAGERRRRVALPGYSFERTRHWVEPGILATPATLPSAPQRDASPPDPDGGGVPEEVMERLMAEQFKIMQEQLEILRTSPEASL